MVYVTVLLSRCILACHITICLSNPLWSRLKRVKADEDAEPHSKPWMVSLQRKCGSFLISRKPHLFLTDVHEGSSDILLTAAHCIVPASHDPAFNIQYPSIVASLGKHNLAVYNEPHQVKIPVEKAIIHEQYRSYYNDIAIIKLEKPVQFNEYIRPIALSQFTLDDVENCSLSGWGKSQNGALKTTVLMGMVDSGTLYHAKHRVNPGISSGDSGSPIVCTKDNNVVAQAIVSHYRSHEDEWDSNEFFVDIVEYLPWILKTLDKIDDPYFYHQELLPYRSFLATNNLTLEILKYYSVGAGLSLNVFERKLNLKVAANYDERWLDRNFYRHFYVKRDVFFILGIFGYEIVADALTCAVLCYDKNSGGICSYVQSAKRCYFSKGGIYGPSSEVSFDSRQLVVIYSEEDSELKYTQQSDKLMSLNAQFDMQSMRPTWNISVLLMDGPFHCTGQMSSSKYPEVEVSTSCVSGVGTRLDDTISDVTVLSMGRRHEDYGVLSFNDSFEMTKAELFLGFNTSFNIGYPEVNIPVTKYPVLREYEPSFGGFMLKPHAAPWIVSLRKKERGEYCVGALLNESLITRAGRNDRTRFLLSTTRCYKERLNRRGTLNMIAGHFFLDLDGYYEQTGVVKKRHVYPYYGQLNVTLDDWPLIMELGDDIVFNSYVQPLDLVTNESVSLDDWSLATVSWDREKYYGPQYAIPLRINQSNLSINGNIKLDDMSTIVTERLYRINDNIINKMDAVSNPLIICHKMNKNCGLLGFYLQSPSPDSTNVEEYFMLNSYLGWIRNVLDKSITNFS